MITLPPTKRYIPDTMLFESQMNINNTNTTLTDNMSMEISYNDTSSSNKIVKDFFNNATLSRLRDFGYVNDVEATTHFNRVNNSLRSHSLRVNREFGMNQYEQIIMNYYKKIQNAFMNPNMIQYVQKKFEMKI